MEERVRGRLRELRRRRGLTLREVADRAGMAVSTLSRLETGARRLSLDHLPALARALDVTVDDLLAAPAPPDPRVRRAAVRRWGMTVWPLSHGTAEDGLQVYKLRIPARRRLPEPRSHPGHDWLFVLSGRLRLVLGEAEHVLEAGEAAEFDTRTPHAFTALDGPCELLSVLGVEGVRVHVGSR
jgi:transcriptional regulator with XRE-family HTH domain